MRRIRYLLMLAALSIGFSGCGTKEVAQLIDEGPSIPISGGYKESPKKSDGTRDNTIRVLEPSADGVEVYGNSDVSIDASNSTEGYVCVSYSGSSKKVRMLIETPVGNTYNYLMDLDGQYDVFPLSEGNGAYKIGVYENIRGDQYSMAYSQTITVQLKDDFTAFLYPNAYVDFDASSKAVQKGKELAEGCNDDLEVVESVYHYMAENVYYDYDKAATVQSGYLPNVDETLATGKGICFDYASLMGAMLRSQGIPTRLDIGYAGTEYHAWVSIYIKDVGWIDGIIQFDGKDWVLMDPTLASYAKKSKIKEHWEDENYYQLMYKY